MRSNFHIKPIAIPSNSGRSPFTILNHKDHPYSLASGGRFSNYTLACIVAYERKTEVLCPDGSVTSSDDCRRIWAGWKTHYDPFFRVAN